MQAVAFSKPFVSETCSDSLDILSALMLSTYGTKGPVLIAKQTPWMHPWLYVNVQTFKKKRVQLVSNLS